MSAAKPVLYSYFRSSCSFRVRIALAWKGIDYDYRAVHLIKDGGEHHTPEYVARNPMHEVPTLEIDGHTLIQSTAIIEYLEESRPDLPKLLPSDPAARAIVRSMVETIASDTQPVQNLRVLKYLVRTLDRSDEEKQEWGRHWIANGLRGLECLLAKYAGKYCYGDQVTVADVVLVPQLYNASRFNVDMSEFPIIQRIAQELNELDAFKAAHPHVQPDCPEDLRTK